MKNYISKIYIIHYTKLTDRKQHMLSEIQKWGLDIVPVYFEERLDQETMTDFDVFQTINKKRFVDNTGRKIKNGEASLCLKYNMILEDIATMNNDEYVLVLEDDVIFKQDPFEYVSDLLIKCHQNNINFDCILKL